MSSRSETGTPAGLCESYAAKLVECNADFDYREELAVCEESLSMYAEISRKCLDAAENYFECEGSAACESDNACDQALGYFFLDCLPEAGPTCMAWATKVVECEMYDESMLPMLGGQCQLAIDYGAKYYGAACGTASEEYYACLAALDCADMEDGACPEEAMARELACS